MSDPQRLVETHTEQAIAERLRAATTHSYLGDFVLGGIDGTVTTFAIVSASAGAGLSPFIAIVLGISNILADGFSMAVSNYFSTKSEHELLARARRREELHVEQHPEGEREEIRQIFQAKGFEGELLESITQTITSERKRWVDTMLIEEHGLRLEPADPVRAAWATFSAFVVAGMIPLGPLFVTSLSPMQTFRWSAVAAGIAFALIGLAKGRVTERPLWRSTLETVLVGGCAAALAYFTGVALRGLLEGLN